MMNVTFFMMIGMTPTWSICCVVYFSVCNDRETFQIILDIRW
jgi:hypothetical protein